ncbi:hypothetical protein LTR84_012722 [Exophiala bonariae]|uniref:Uncharacterized protein n=1 Tax=Exophiala bonariae TaxID=1690606 RepID=A0AAV9NH24_9EURO|nr:hypothetical protein LTR84_012722 [Exophiala bonariae]
MTDAAKSDGPDIRIVIKDGDIDPDLLEKLYKVTEDLFKKTEFKHFAYVSIICGLHNSDSDNQLHATVRMATKAQAARKVCQTMHVYYDEEEEPLENVTTTPWPNEHKMKKIQWPQVYK